MPHTAEKTHENKEQYSFGMLTFLCMFFRWLSPSENLRILIGPALPPKEATSFASSYILCIMSCVLACLILISELIVGKVSLSILPVCGVMVCSVICSMWTTKTKNTTLPSTVLALYVVGIGLYYMLTGEVMEDMIFYYFLIPPLLTFCLPLQQSSIIYSAFLFVLCIAFFPPAHSYLPRQYPVDFRVRFLVALTCVFVVSLLAEYIMVRLLNSIYILNSQFEAYSLTDPLTGLGNRRNCISQFQRLHAIQLRSGNPFSMLMIDMDHFKEVNDRHGHLTGDKVLRFVAETLDHGLRRQDTLYRWGGEEFIMLLPGASLEQAETAAERLRHIIEHTPFEDGPVTIRLTASFGAYMVDSPQEMAEHLKKIDELLYQAKNMGRNHVISQRTAPKINN